jgi:hypothetical protein
MRNALDLEGLDFSKCHSREEAASPLEMAKKNPSENWVLGLKLIDNLKKQLQ